MGSLQIAHRSSCRNLGSGSFSKLEPPQTLSQLLLSKLVTTILLSQEYSVVCSVTYNFVYTVLSRAHREGERLAASRIPVKRCFGPCSTFVLSACPCEPSRFSSSSLCFCFSTGGAPFGRGSQTSGVVEAKDHVYGAAVETSSSSPCHSSATTRQCSRVPLAFSPSSCWHGLPALQQHLVGSYREDTCAGWELLEYMVNAVAFVFSGVYMVAKLRSSDTGGSDVLTCSTIFLSA